jgi:hypothetical protein
MATGHGMLINLHQLIYLFDNYGESRSHEPMRKAIGQDEICDIIIKMLY